MLYISILNPFVIYIHYNYQFITIAEFSKPLDRFVTSATGLLTAAIQDTTIPLHSSHEQLLVQVL